ncbi:MAG: hypothetical protein AB7F09_17865 [Parvibaculaceae bacterium]
MLVGAGAFLTVCGTAHAEVGQASAAPGQWYLGFTAGGGALWGTDHEAYMGGGEGPITPGPDTLHPVNFDAGVFFSGGVDIGYRFESAAVIDRIELNLDLGMQSRNIDHDTSHAFFALEGSSPFGAYNWFDPQLRAAGNEDTGSIETRLSFKGLLLDNEDGTVVGSLEPFFRFQDTDSLLEVTRRDREFASRSDDIEAEYYGLQIAFEVERPVSEALSLVGRASAGAYYVTSDIDSRQEGFDEPVGDPFSASANSWGGRFGGALGLKVPLYHTGASLTLMGTVDYMTDVATIDHSPYQRPTETKAAFDDQLEVGGEVGLVFPLTWQ